jgi:hypothetical protein
MDSQRAIPRDSAAYQPYFLTALGAVASQVPLAAYESPHREDGRVQTIVRASQALADAAYLANRLPTTGASSCRGRSSCSHPTDLTEAR